MPHIVGMSRPIILRNPAIFLIIRAMTGRQATAGVVSTTYVRLLYEYLAARGIDPAGLLGAPPPDASDRGLGRFPMAQWQALLEKAAGALDDPLLGLHLGQSITTAHLGTVGYVLLACANLGEAFLRMQKYMRLIYDAEPMQVQIRQDAVELEWGTGFGRPGQQVDAAAITALLQFARDMTDGACAPSYVSFINPAPAIIEPYLRYFGCPVAFAQPTTMVRFPTGQLALPLRRPDPALREILEQQAELLLAQLPQADAFVQSLRRAVMQLVETGAPTLRAVAGRLHMSERSLQRRLAERGLRYQAVLDDCRRRLAEDYLADPRLQMREVAQLLGYSEQSAFNHAFRRWTGTTPRAHRLAASGPGMGASEAARA